MPPIKVSLAAAAALTLLAGCSRDNEIVDAAGGIAVTRSACPALAIPDYTGDVTLFNPPASRDSRAIDVVATITNLRANCDNSGAELVSTISFDVVARREAGSEAREVVLPYFVSIVRGGNVVVAKRLGRVSLRFAEGQQRATAQATAGSVVNKAAATLPEEVVRQITRRRKPGDADAAVDPMANPQVRAAVSRASFEMLVGFQLDQDQLRYNVTR
ncbi:hypothetical protein FHS96_000193 [Sphingomonas zeicaulis]|uniref:hypothetical protein n=1 Tax=Sphingomonas zeicaulis TaxID=1632740 RepID=UPI003D24E83D